jgi:hypothetical protein
MFFPDQSSYFTISGLSGTGSDRKKTKEKEEKNE